jgi:hypothetical protein
VGVVKEAAIMRRLYLDGLSRRFLTQPAAEQRKAA